MTPFFVEVALLAGALFALMASRASRAPIGWGALWGIALGLWIVATPLLHVHHFHPTDWRQWVVVSLLLAAAFAGIGATLAFVVCLPLAPWRPRRFLAAIVAALLPPAYLASAVILEWALVSHLPGAPAYVRLFPAVLAWSAAAGGATLLATLALERTGVAPGPWLRGGIAAMAVAGSAALPFRLVATKIPPVANERLQRRDATAAKTPLLVIGLDSATWRVLTPLLDQGRLPVLNDLIRTGSHGDMQGLWPPYWSAPAWGAIVTGHSAEQIGLHEDLTASFFGGPSFEVPATLDLTLDPVFAVEYLLTRVRVMRTALHSRDALHASPIWERLSNAGVKTGVICFPFTYPAQGQASVVISRRIAADIWKLAGVTAGNAGSVVEPAAEAAKWRQWFSADHPIDVSSLRAILPRLDWPKPPDSVLNPVDQLRESWDLTMRVFGATDQIVTDHRELQVVMMYIGSLDTVLHTFWQYRFPEDFPEDPPRREDVDALGGVIDRYAELVDAQIGALLRSFETRPNVLIVSDHGHGPDRDSTLFRGFHTATGIFVASGPDIPHRADPLTVSYYDVTPTILDLEGFEIPASLSGRSRREQE